MLLIPGFQIKPEMVKCSMVLHLQAPDQTTVPYTGGAPLRVLQYAGIDLLKEVTASTPAEGPWEQVEVRSASPVPLCRRSVLRV